MKKMVKILAYFWAFVCMLLIPVTFIKNDALAEQLARLPFMKVHPRYSGGTPAYTSQSASGLQMVVYHPVYAGIRGKGIHGFVQVKFSTPGKLPGIIRENVDVDNDGHADFQVEINTITGNSRLESFTPRIKSLSASSRVKADWVIRVNVVQE